MEDDYLSVKISYDTIEELTLVGLKDQYEGVLENFEENTQSEDLVWAYELVLRYNMNSDGYRRFMEKFDHAHPLALTREPLTADFALMKKND